MDALEAHQKAQDAFARVLANVDDAALESPTPCTEWSVRNLVDHVVAGNRRSAGLDPEAADAGARASGITAAHASSAHAAQAAFAAPGGLTRSFTLPFGTLPGAQYLGLRTTDVLVHAWDLAKATCQETDFEPELAADRLEAARGLLGPDSRGEGKPFAKEAPCAPDAAPLDRLAAFFGRPLRGDAT